MSYVRPAGDARRGARAAGADGAAPLGGGTDVPGRSTAASASRRCSSTCRRSGSGRDRATAARARHRRDDDAGRRGGDASMAPYARRAHRRRLGRVAAPAQRRHRRRQPLPAHALLVLPRPRVALLARRRRHLLRADRRPPQAQPRARRLHLGASVRPRAGPRRLRRDGRRALGGRRARAAAARPLPPPDRGRPVAADARPGRARDGRAAARAAGRLGLRAGRRAAGVLVPARRRRRRAARRRPCVSSAAGVANVPRELDPADPLAGLPGQPAERLEAPRAGDAGRAASQRLRRATRSGRRDTRCAGKRQAGPAL